MKKAFLYCLPAYFGFCSLALGSSTHSTMPLSPSAQWKGFYIGADAGATYNDIMAKTIVVNNGSYFTGNDGVLIGNAGRQGRHAVGALAGMNAGYNWNISDYILGFETSADWFYLNNTKSNTTQYQTLPGTYFTLKSKVKSSWLVTLHPRFGYAFYNYLAYVTGGLAISNMTSTYNFSDDAFAANESTSLVARVGWIAGAGIDMKFRRHWSAGLSYAFIQFPRENHTGLVSTNNNTTLTAMLYHRTKMHTNLLKIGINYYFS